MTENRLSSERGGQSEPATAGPEHGSEEKHALEVVRVSKRFGGVAALTDVSARFARRGIHGLVGENGAGKSTLVRILSGSLAPDEGELLLDGQRTRFGTPRSASESGIALVEQEPTFVPELPVAANIMLGHERTKWGRVLDRDHRARCRSLADAVGFELDLESPAGLLSVAQQQEMVILRALARQATFLIMDEPTAALTSDEANKLLKYAQALREQGLGIIFVSHALDQVLTLCDRVTVLRDGRVVMTRPTEGLSKASLIRAMIGQELEFSGRPSSTRARAGTVLRAEGLTRRGAFEDISFDLRTGEVLGLAGLIGSGRTEVARALVGADPFDAGSILVDGREVRFRGPRSAFRAGVAMVPEDRRSQGLIGPMTIRDNLTLATLESQAARGGWIRRRAEEEIVRRVGESVQLKMPGPEFNIFSLSGGNQQKVVFGRWLAADSLRVLIADEPTRGVDVGAKEAIYELLEDLRDLGLAILVVSSELEELTRLADRILVMRRGRIVGELEHSEVNPERMLQLAFGA